MMSIDERKVFAFERFGLHTTDEKLTNLINDQQDGIIIIFKKFSKSVQEKCIQIVNEFKKNRPILIVCESENDSTLANSKQFSDIEKLDSNVKYFYISNYNVTDVINVIDDAHSWFIEKLQHNVRSAMMSSSSTITVQLTSKTMPLQVFVQKFQDCSLPLHLWDHFGRLRIVHYAITTLGFETAINPVGWLCTCWKRYKQSIGHGHLWNYTLTRFWAHILDNLQRQKRYSTFAELYQDNLAIHSGKYHEKFYSNDVLFSDRAKTSWVHYLK